MAFCAQAAINVANSMIEDINNKRDEGDKIRKNIFTFRSLWLKYKIEYKLLYPKGKKAVVADILKSATFIFLFVMIAVFIYFSCDGRI